MTHDPIAIAKKAYLAYRDGDRAAIEEVMADDLHFTSPLDNRIDRETYFARCWPNHGFISDFRFIHTVRHGENVFVTYEGKGADDRVFRNTEILTIRDGKIVEVEVYFGWNIPHRAPAGGFVDSE